MHARAHQKIERLSAVAELFQQSLLVCDPVGQHTRLVARVQLLTAALFRCWLGHPALAAALPAGGAALVVVVIVGVPLLCFFRIDRVACGRGT